MGLGKTVMNKHMKLLEADLPVSSIFESMRSYKGRIFKLQEHLDRLYESAQTSGFKIHWGKDRLRKKILEEFRQAGLKDAYIRVSLLPLGNSPSLDNVADSGMGPVNLCDSSKLPVSDKTNIPTDIVPARPGQISRPFPAHVQIQVIVKPITHYPPEYYQKGISLITVAVRKNIPSAVEPRIKSSDFLWGVMAKIEAFASEAFEILCLSHQGYVAEGSVSNIFMVKTGRLITPPASSGILEGITAHTVIELARKMKIELIRQPITRHELYNAHEVFLTNTSLELMPVASIDGRTIGQTCPGKVTRRIHTAYRKLT